MKSFLEGRKASQTRTGHPDLPAHPPAPPRGSSPSSRAAAPGLSGALQPRVKSGGHPDHGAPEIECLRQGDRIVSILITCSCGERIELDCLYPER